MIGLLMLAASGGAAPAWAPREVRAFIARREACDHWAGEEPYDAARGREIEAAERRLRCDRLDGDARRLQRRYPRAGRLLDATADAF